MRQAVLAFALFGYAACARLDYLPPLQGAASGTFSGAKSLSGAGAPSGSGGFSGSSGAFSYSGSSGPQVPILRLDANNEGDGTYRYSYETGNGISAQEQGDARGDGTRAQGGFSYTSSDGQLVSIQYTADENGFQPQGSHIPTPPPIPEEIQRALQQNLADEARGVVDDGQYRGDSSGQYRDDGAGRYKGNDGGFSGQFGRSSGQFGGSSSGQGQSGGYRY